MKKTKMERGITLLALIITIVVLLILAGVAISSIQETDLIAQAESAKNVYEQKEEEEKNHLNMYGSIIDAYMPLPEGLVKFRISHPGGLVIYAAEEEMTWFDWCQSKYNNGDWKCEGSDASVEYVNSSIGKITVKRTSGDEVKGRDIIKNTTYISERYYDPEEGETANLIIFSIDGKQYFAEEEMTWFAWCNSKYNESNGIFACDGEDKKVTYKEPTANKDGYVYDMRHVVGDYVKGNDKILSINEYSYANT